LELIDGRELYDEIVERRSLDERWAAGIMQQVFGALKYCHEKNVMHRDLKPENIMIRHSSVEDSTSSNSVPQVVLIDFGMAMVYEGRPLAGSGSAIMGTSDYMAPEAARGHCVPASDVWSAGVVLYALLVGHLPSKHESIFFGEEWADVSTAARELVSQLLEIDVSSRVTAARASEHAWTRGIASVSLSPKHVKKMVSNFMSFHSSQKLRRAALTALAMQLTDQQMSEHREQFMTIDADGNGCISKQELIESIAASSPLCPQDVRKWAESVFDSVDTDGSQEIDYTEWLAAVTHENTCRSEETMRAAFRVFDIDGDGKIDEAEFARVVAQTPQEIAALLPQFDTNGDGVIDFDEFKSLLCASAMESVGQPLRGLSRTSNTSEPQQNSTIKVANLFPPSPASVHLPMSFSL
jgi:calcium-dependent protein kinase